MININPNTREYINIFLHVHRFLTSFLRNCSPFFVNLSLVHNTHSPVFPPCLGSVHWNLCSFTQNSNILQVAEGGYAKPSETIRSPWCVQVDSGIQSQVVTRDCCPSASSQCVLMNGSSHVQVKHELNSSNGNIWGCSNIFAHLRHRGKKTVFFFKTQFLSKSISFLFSVVCFAFLKLL